MPAGANLNPLLACGAAHLCGCCSPLLYTLRAIRFIAALLTSIPLSHMLSLQAADERAAGLAQQVQQLERQAAELRTQLGEAASKHVQVGQLNAAQHCCLYQTALSSAEL